MSSLARLYVVGPTAKTMGLSILSSLWILGRSYSRALGLSRSLWFLVMYPSLLRLFSAWVTLDSMDDVYVPSSSMHSTFLVYSFLSMTTVTLPLFAERMTISLSLRSSLVALCRWFGGL